jgi:putative N6-adenine-specific DNA methylase
VNIYKDSSTIVITCNKRLAPYLEQELEDLGYSPTGVYPTRVELTGTMVDCIRLNLNLRCGSQIHFSLKRFQAKSGDELYRALEDIAWEEIIPKDGYFSVTCTVDTPSINNTMFVNVKVKDAIVDRIRQKTGIRPDSGPSQEKACLYLYWKDNEAEIFIDTSGETLAKHGYRKIPGKAPMLEALAAATIYATKWDRASAFVNPMCGSGTLAVEAALIATNRKPGLYRRNYSFMHFTGFEIGNYHREFQKLKDQVKDVPGLKIYASDISEDAVNVTRTNAEIAEVSKYIHLQECDFEKALVPEDQAGVVYFNPEYGERLGEVGALEVTYKRIGDFMKQRCKGYTGYIFTGNLDLAKKIGLRASRRLEFYNAKIDCRLLEYELYSGTRDKDKLAKEEL